jgi:hypothetical protein
LNNLGTWEAGVGKGKLVAMKKPCSKQRKNRKNEGKREFFTERQIFARGLEQKMTKSETD